MGISPQGESMFALAVALHEFRDQDLWADSASYHLVCDNNGAHDSRCSGADVARGCSMYPNFMSKCITGCSSTTRAVLEQTSRAAAPCIPISCPSASQVAAPRLALFWSRRRARLLHVSQFHVQVHHRLQHHDWVVLGRSARSAFKLLRF